MIAIADLDAILDGYAFRARVELPKHNRVAATRALVQADPSVLRMHEHSLNPVVGTVDGPEHERLIRGRVVPSYYLFPQYASVERRNNRGRRAR